MYKYHFKFFFILFLSSITSAMTAQNVPCLSQVKPYTEITAKVNVLLPEKGGTVLVGTDEGVFRVSKRNKPPKVLVKRGQLQVSCLYIDENSSIWVTYNDTLGVIDKFSGYLRPISALNTKGEIESLIIEPDDSIGWVATNTGLYKINIIALKNRWANAITLFKGKKNTDSRVKCLYRSEEKEIIVGTYKGLKQLPDMSLPFARQELRAKPIDVITAGGNYRKDKMTDVEISDIRQTDSAMWLVEYWKAKGEQPPGGFIYRKKHDSAYWEEFARLGASINSQKDHYLAIKSDSVVLLLTGHKLLTYQKSKSAKLATLCSFCDNIPKKINARFTAIAPCMEDKITWLGTDSGLFTIKQSPFPCDSIYTPDVKFGNDVKILNDKAKKELDVWVFRLLADDSLSIDIQGHTSWLTDTLSANKLSQTRADAVKAYFISKKVKAKQIKGCKGYGYKNPIYKMRRKPDGKPINKEEEENDKTNNQRVNLIIHCPN